MQVIGTVEEEDEDDRKENDKQVLHGIKEYKKSKLPRDTKLKVKVTVEWMDGSRKELEALVDTGAEVNLINPKLMDSALFTPSSRPVRLGVANSLLLKGGGREATMSLTFQGVDLDTGKNVRMSLPLTAYDGDVVCDLILSYGWLAQNDILINPRRHGLLLQGPGSTTFVAGLVKKRPKAVATFKRVPIEALVQEDGTLAPEQVSLSSTPTEPPGPPTCKQQDDLQEVMVAHLLEQREELTHLTSFFKSLKLEAGQTQTGMGCPDIPGLADDVQKDFLTDEDLEELAKEFHKKR